MLIACFPNPTENSVTIELFGELKANNYDLELQDAMGVLIAHKKNQEGVTKLDLTDFSNGIYHLTVRIDLVVIHKKIVKH